MRHYEGREAGARRLLEAIEDVRLTGEFQPPAGGEPVVGCGGKGCLDMTCPYCCESFADPEDVAGQAAVHTARIGGGLLTLDDQPIARTEEGGMMMLLPPAPDVCQVCATPHEAHMPHNQGSMYYSFTFHMQHGRVPTWTDAAAHCTQEVKEKWFVAMAIIAKEKGGLPVPADVAEFLIALRERLNAARATIAATPPPKVDAAGEGK